MGCVDSVLEGDFLALAEAREEGRGGGSPGGVGVVCQGRRGGEHEGGTAPSDGHGGGGREERLCHCDGGRMERGLPHLVVAFMMLQKHSPCYEGVIRLIPPPAPTKVGCNLFCDCPMGTLDIYLVVIVTGGVMLF